MFEVQGCLCHKAGSLIPREGQAPVYAQLYTYDAQNALNFHMNYATNFALNHMTMQTLQDMLHCHYSGIGLYKQAIELTRDMGLDQQCKIALYFEPNADCCHYNLFTAIFIWMLEIQEMTIKGRKSLSSNILNTASIHAKVNQTTYL